MNATATIAPAATVSIALPVGQSHRAAAEAAGLAGAEFGPAFMAGKFSVVEVSNAGRFGRVLDADRVDLGHGGQVVVDRSMPVVDAITLATDLEAELRSASKKAHNKVRHAEREVAKASRRLTAAFKAAKAAKKANAEEIEELRKRLRAARGGTARSAVLAALDALDGAERARSAKADLAGAREVLAAAEAAKTDLAEARAAVRAVTAMVTDQIVAREGRWLAPGQHRAFTALLEKAWGLIEEL